VTTESTLPSNRSARRSWNLRQLRSTLSENKEEHVKRDWKVVKRRFEADTGLMLGDPSLTPDGLMPDFFDKDLWPGRDVSLREVLESSYLRDNRDRLKTPTEEERERKKKELETIFSEFDATAQDIESLQQSAIRVQAHSHSHRLLDTVQMEAVQVVSGIEGPWLTRPTGRRPEEHLGVLRWFMAHFEILRRIDGRKLENRDIAHLLCLMQPAFLEWEHGKLVEHVRKHRSGLVLKRLRKIPPDAEGQDICRTYGPEYPDDADRAEKSR